MSVEIAQAVWEELKRYIGTMDKVDAADSLVNLLVDSNFDADEIRSAFAGDADIKKSLKAYLEDHDDEENDEDSYDESNFDDDEY